METKYPVLRAFLLQWFKSFVGNIIFFILFFLCFTAFGQQEPGYTQFMFNKLPINPAYAGGREKLSIRLQYRDQWTQLEGHPRTLNMSIHGPLSKENIAIGGSLTYDRLGITTQMKLSTSYAYRIKIKPGGKQHMKISMGLNAGMLMYKAALSEVDPVENNDPTFRETFTRILPDLGAGVYFSGTNFYAGASIPNFLPANIRGNALGEDVTNAAVTQRVPHLYMMAGGVIPLGKDADFKLRPQ
ncbi:MAG TPA: type IX secretion system membrane protein PorP/SprF, partial [Chitinophagaceae bacterium]|nr:type IX secretion system membrane protein PorP/SprF [Chitinophagaceae bacterium]